MAKLLRSSFIANSPLENTIREIVRQEVNAQDVFQPNVPNSEKRRFYRMARESIVSEGGFAASVNSSDVEWFSPPAHFLWLSPSLTRGLKGYCWMMKEM